MNFNVTKRARPGQSKCPIDFPTVVDRHPIQFLPFTQNFVTSTHALGLNTVLDVVETAAMNTIAEGFRTCKFLFENITGREGLGLY